MSKSGSTAMDTSPDDLDIADTNAQNDVASRVAEGKRAGNINIGSGEDLSVSYSESFLEEKALRDEQMKELERSKLRRSIIVPTDDELVQARLRLLQVPIALFGERAPERRERLKALMITKLVDENIDVNAIVEQRELERASIVDDHEVEKAFFTKGTPALQVARQRIAVIAKQRATARLESERKRHSVLSSDKQAEEQARAAYHTHVNRLRNDLASVRTEVGATRAISAVAFAVDATRFATGSWDGTIKIWSVPECSHVLNLKNGHNDHRIADVAFHPTHTDLVASGGIDNTVCIWKLPATGADKPKRVPKVTPTSFLRGHYDRCARIAFHPGGDWLASSSYDKTWRLWDIQTGKSVLVQQGHAAEVYGLAFHPDGALAVTGDLGGVMLAWDVRVGKPVLNMVSHAKQVLGCDVSPDGFHVASASGDGMVHIWDLRKKMVVYRIAGHTRVVSDVKFDQTNGQWLASTSFDGSCKIWSGLDYSLITSLAAHDGRVMRCAISSDSEFLVTGASDRNYKLWSSRADLGVL